MAEGYQGVKFRVEMQDQQVPSHPLLRELKRWCGIFHEKGLAPPYPGGSYGNLSFRTGPGDNSFIITGTCMGLKACLSDDHFVKVIDCDFERAVIRASGSRQPSSESMMHFALYQSRPDIHAIFHGHSAGILAIAGERGLPVTPDEYPYGTVALADALVLLCRHADFVIAKNHGFVSLGGDMEAAGQQALQYLL